MDRCNVATASCPGLFGLFCPKFVGFEGSLSQLFKDYIWGAHLVDIFLSYLPVKQILKKKCSVILCNSCGELNHLYLLSLSIYCLIFQMSKR